MPASANGNGSFEFSTWLPSLEILNQSLQLNQNLKSSSQPSDMLMKPSVDEVHQTISDGLQELQSILFDQVHHQSQLEIDDWERNYAINYLTRLLSISLQLSESLDGLLLPTHSWNSISDLSAHLIAVLTGSPATSAQPFTRTLGFELRLDHGSSRSIQVEIREDTMSYPAIGCQTWNAAPLLCNRLCADPYRFFPQLAPSSHTSSDLTHHGPSTATFTRDEDSLDGLSRRSLKILELGAGTGLVGITTATLLSHLLTRLDPTEDPIDVELVLTDYHPKVLTNLDHNLQLNSTHHLLPDQCHSTLSVRAEVLDWRTLTDSSLAQSGYQSAFDIILGSDLVYEPQHAIWASNAVRYFLKPHLIPNPPLSNSTSSAVSRSIQPPTFHLLLPLRPTFARESHAVHVAFGGKDLSQLLDASTITDLDSLPTHNCDWEEERKIDLPSQSPITKSSPIIHSLQIREYVKESGASFGQGCGEYQYLRITQSL